MPRESGIAGPSPMQTGNGATQFGHANQAGTMMGMQ